MEPEKKSIKFKEQFNTLMKQLFVACFMVLGITSFLFLVALEITAATQCTNGAEYAIWPPEYLSGTDVYVLKECPSLE